MRAVVRGPGAHRAGAGVVATSDGSPACPTHLGCSHKGDENERGFFDHGFHKQVSKVMVLSDNSNSESHTKQEQGQPETP